MKITSVGRKRLESPDFKHALILFAEGWKHIALDLVGMEALEYLLSMTEFSSRMIAHVAMGNDLQTFEEMAHRTRQMAFIDANRHFVKEYINSCRRLQTLSEAVKSIKEKADHSYRPLNTGEVFDPSTSTMHVMFRCFTEIASRMGLHP